MAPPDGFQQSSIDFNKASQDFKAFQVKAPDLIKQTIRRNPRFAELEGAAGFRVETMGDTVTARFNGRFLGRPDWQGKPGREEGVALHYSFGGTGEVVVSLYPAKSEIQRMGEEMIHLFIGPLRACQLEARLKADLNDLVAYGHVSSMGGKPTWWERSRIRLLQEVRPTQVEGKFEPPRSKAYLAKGFGLLARSLLAAFFRPLALLIVGALLLYFGYPHLLELLPR